MPTNEKLIVPPFNKEDIKEIVKELTKNTVESYPNATAVLVADSEDHDLTPEILAFIIHCFEVGKINYNDYLMSLNCAYVNNGAIQGLCFGCVQNNSDGAHLEIAIVEGKYQAYYGVL